MSSEFVVVFAAAIVVQTDYLQKQEEESQTPEPHHQRTGDPYEVGTGSDVVVVDNAY